LNTVYSVYIHLGVIRVIWSSVVCNLDHCTLWCRESDPSIPNRRFQPLRFAIEVTYIFVSVKAVAVTFLVWENTARKQPYSHELTSKTTSDFAYKGISRGLRKNVLAELTLKAN